MKWQQKHMAEETVMTLRQADGLNAQEGDQGKRLKELETENACLWRAASDLTLDKMMLSEVARTFSPLAAELVGFMLSRNVVCQNDGYALFLVSIAPHSVKSSRRRIMRQH